MIDSGLSVRKAARSSDTARRAIPAHPMGIVQQRPRGDLWSPAEWYAAEWWRRRLAWLSGRDYYAGFGKRKP